MRATALLTALLLSSTAFAQEPPSAPSALTRNCFDFSGGTTVHGHTHVGSVGNVGNVGATVPSGSTQASSSASAPLSGVSGGGGGSGEAILIVAVAAAVALPIIVYAIDEPANEEVLFRYNCPSVRLQLTGGAINTPSNQGSWAPLAGARFSYGQSAFGLSASYESTFDPRFFGAMDVHLLLRPPPKRHIEGAFAIGARRVVFGGAQRDGLDVALPHRYVFTRVGTYPVGIDVTPGVFLGQRGLDYRLDAGLTFPIGFTSLQFGARVFSFDDHIRAGGYLGFGTGI